MRFIIRLFAGVCCAIAAFSPGVAYAQKRVAPVIGNAPVRPHPGASQRVQRCQGDGGPVPGGQVRQRGGAARPPFAVGKFEVTFAEWDACVAAGGCRHNTGDDYWGRGKRPVINVSWDDITKEYLPWLSRKTGKTYRLLSEAEWEYAARTGTTTPYATGRTIKKSEANFEAGSTVVVGSYPANAFGLHDMHGNVWEWVQDCWNGSYGGAPSDGSAWATGDCGRRALRGGSWVLDPRDIRAAHRDGDFTGESTVSGSLHLTGRPQPTPPLVELGAYRLPPLSDAILVDHGDAIRLFAPPVNPRESICHAYRSRLTYL